MDGTFKGTVAWGSFLGYYLSPCTRPPWQSWLACWWGRDAWGRPWWGSPAWPPGTPCWRFPRRSPPPGRTRGWTAATWTPDQHKNHLTLFQYCGFVTFWYGSGSASLTNGFGSGSWPSYFRQWPSRWQQNFFSNFFCLLPVLFELHLHHFSKIKS